MTQQEDAVDLSLTDLVFALLHWYGGSRAATE